MLLFWFIGEVSALILLWSRTTRSDLWLNYPVCFWKSVMEFLELIERWNVWRFSGCWSKPTILCLTLDLILLVSRSKIFSFFISWTIYFPSFLLIFIGILRSNSLTSYWFEKTCRIMWLELRELASPELMFKFWLELLWFIFATSLLKFELWFLNTWGCFLLPTFGWVYFCF